MVSSGLDLFLKKVRPCHVKRKKLKQHKYTLLNLVQDIHVSKCIKDIFNNYEHFGENQRSVSQ